MTHGLLQIMSGKRDKYLQAFKITCNNLHEAGQAPGESKTPNKKKACVWQCGEEADLRHEKNGTEDSLCSRWLPAAWGGLRPRRCCHQHRQASFEQFAKKASRNAYWGRAAGNRVRHGHLLNTQEAGSHVSDDAAHRAQGMRAWH